MSKIEQTLLAIIQIIVTILGVYVVLGWILLNPAIVRVVPGSPTMVLNTALCFIVSGTWLFLRPPIPTESVSHSRISIGLALFLIILPGLVLLQMAVGVDLGIDNLALHQAILDRNLTPGRMAPNTCMGFILTGMAFLAGQPQPSRKRRRFLLVLSALIFLLGVSSLLVYIMKLEWLYYSLTNNRMAIPTSAGLSLLGIAIFVIAQNSPDAIRQIAPDVRITRIAAVIMITLALTSGLAGFLVLKQGTDQFLQAQLLQKAANGVETITASLNRQVLMKDELLSFPVFQQDLQNLPDHPDDQMAREHLGKVMHILFDLGFSAIQLKNVKGEVVYSEGALVENPGLSFPLKIMGEDLRLMSGDNFIVHSEKPIFKDGIMVGSFITEQKMTGFDRLFRQLRYAGQTTDAVLCQRVGDFYDCMPSRFVPYSLRTPMFKDGSPNYPMARALLGESGTLYANDTRGIPVLAAYIPVGETGLALVVKIETVEFYGFIRQRLHILLGLLVFFVLSGIYMLRFQLQPLAARLVQSEKRTRRANDDLAQDTERLNRIIEVQSKIALSPLDITTTLHIIVQSVQDLTHAAGAVVELVEGDELRYSATCGSFANFVGMRLKIFGSLSGHCIASRQIIRCDDTEADPRTDKASTRKLNIRSMIVAPLVNEGRVLGVLKTAAAETNVFTAKDEQALQLLSALIGSAIGHQQDYEEKQRLLGEKTATLAELEKTTDFLRISEERTRIIIESAYDAFIAMDGKGNITDWNRHAEKIFGWTKEQVLGKNPLDFIIAPEFCSLFAARLALVLKADYQEEENQRLELNVMRYSGGEFVVEMTMSAIRTPDGVMLATFLHDITERRQNQEKLTQLAQYDALTGLPNRALFMDRLSVAVLRIERAQRGMALLFLDLDAFKKINDGYGHQAGDNILKLFSQRLTASVRKTDTVARLAGDEFVIILENLAEPEHDAQVAAGKIIANMWMPFDVGGENITLTTSIGIAVTQSGKNIDDLIKYADAEMYKAKNKGTNQFSLCTI